MGEKQNIFVLDGKDGYNVGAEYKGPNEDLTIHGKLDNIWQIVLSNQKEIEKLSRILETNYKENLVRSYHETAREGNGNSRGKRELAPSKEYQNGQTKKDVGTQIMLYDEFPRIQSPNRKRVRSCDYTSPQINDTETGK